MQFHPKTSLTQMTAADEPFWYPHSYVLRTEQSRCQGCNEVHTASTFWLVHANYRHPTVRRETPVTMPFEAKPNLMITKVETSKEQPVCHLCLVELAFHLGFNEPKIADPLAWAEAIRLDAIAQANAHKAKHLPKAPTFDAETLL